MTHSPPLPARPLLPARAGTSGGATLTAIRAAGHSAMSTSGGAR